jgi:diguanylate cyclase (GGDEF)-like protein
MRFNLRRTHPDVGSAREARVDRQPRLVLRFAVVTAVGLALAGALILGVIREIDQRQAVRAATDRAHFVAETFLRGAIRRTDVAGPVTGVRRDELDRLMRRYVLIDGALRVSVVGSGNRITYSTDHRLIGTTTRDRAEMADVRRGSIVSRVAGVPAQDRGDNVKALVASVPVALGQGTVAVVTIEQDYAPIAAAARETLLPVAGVLELALVILFVLLLPALMRTSRRLRRYVAEIHHQARHDSLTGLSNRLELHDNVRNALDRLEEGEHAAVLLIDLDRFKEVNDSLGHDAGDELLRDIAARLVEVADGAPVSRLGGDEFAVVLAPTTPRQAVEVGHALRRIIEAPGSVRGIPVSVDASIGIALAPEDGTDVGQLVRRADVAMYAAKQGRGGVMRYDVETDRNDANKLVLMTELRVAVERGELEVHYQPIVAAGSGQLEKVEALVRWRHPSRGLLQPGAFIPLAEHTRLIIELNRFVLCEAIRQCAVWRRLGIDLGVTVNTTVLDLLDPTYATGIEATLREAGFPPSALTIEITEGAFVQEPARVRRTLETLRALGVQVAIDDFGTGYSSLGYLKELPVDLLKIDRSFVSDLPGSEASAAIVAAAIELSHRLGLAVVAEGVETPEQYEFLAELGCDLIQGYLVSKPVSASALASLIEDARCSQRPAA